MIIKYLDSDGCWNLIENSTGINWKYEYKNHFELVKLLDDDDCHILEYPEHEDEATEPPANGYRTLVLNLVEQDEPVNIVTVYPVYVLNDNGKTIENLTP